MVTVVVPSPDELNCFIFSKVCVPHNGFYVVDDVVLGDMNFSSTNSEDIWNLLYHYPGDWYVYSKRKLPWIIYPNIFEPKAILAIIEQWLCGARATTCMWPIVHVCVWGKHFKIELWKLEPFHWKAMVSFLNRILMHAGSTIKSDRSGSWAFFLWINHPPLITYPQNISGNLMVDVSSVFGGELNFWLVQFVRNISEPNLKTIILTHGPPTNHPTKAFVLPPDLVSEIYRWKFEAP